VRLYVFGGTTDVWKYRSAFIVKVKLQSFYLDQLRLCMSVVTVFVAGCRIQDPTVHPVRQEFRKNSNRKSTEISPAGAASKRTWHQKVEPVEINCFILLFFVWRMMPWLFPEWKFKYPFSFTTPILSHSLCYLVLWLWKHKHYFTWQVSY